MAAFAEQLAESGFHMRTLFSVREVWRASDRVYQKNDGEAVYLTAKWASREAFLRTWCDYLGGASYPFMLNNLPWSEIEILDDSHSVPYVSLGEGTVSTFQTDCADSTTGARHSSVYSSASDNGPYAVMQEWRNTRSAQRSAFGVGSAPHIHILSSYDGPIASAVVTVSVEQRWWLGESWVAIVEPV